MKYGTGRCGSSYCGYNENSPSYLLFCTFAAMSFSIRNIAILGSTGSIGTQALEVVAAQPDRFRVVALTAHSNVDLLIHQARRFRPLCVLIGDIRLYVTLRDALKDLNITVLAGEEHLSSVVRMPEIETVLTALVGFAGLLPTYEAIRAGKTIALANKETLVVGGPVIVEAARERNIPVLPVDSEHSAIFQCLVGEGASSVEKIYLTASGGPFRKYSRHQLESVTLQQALKHPNWSMGSKITIDSATMMNKGLEVIEAKWLFGLENEQIEIVVHPQSIVHSLVQFQDGSIKAQLGLPDMRLPIQYALSYPDRLKNNFPRFDFLKHPTLTFETVDRTVFRSIEHAYFALGKNGNMPCILNAANEVAVGAFLQEKIRFVEIFDYIERALQTITYLAQPSLEDLIETDQLTRRVLSENLN